MPASARITTRTTTGTTTRTTTRSTSRFIPRITRTTTKTTTRSTTRPTPNTTRTKTHTKIRIKTNKAPHTSRAGRVKKPRSSRPKPAPAKPSALEESNRQYEAHLADQEQRTCNLCYGINPPGAPALYTCPNPACAKPICADCKASAAANSWRCSFCRRPVDDATLSAAGWRHAPDGRLVRAVPNAPQPPPALRITSPEELTPATPPATLRLALQVPHLYDAAYAACVQARIIDAVDAWRPHFRGSGVPDAWLRGQADELRREAGRLCDDARARNLVRGMTGLWRFETERERAGKGAAK